MTEAYAAYAAHDWPFHMRRLLCMARDACTFSLDLGTYVGVGIERLYIYNPNPPFP